MTQHKIGPSGPDETWVEGDLYQVNPLMIQPISAEEADSLNQQLADHQIKATAAEASRQEFNLLRPCPKCRFVPKTQGEAAEVHYCGERADCTRFHGSSEHQDRRCRVCHYTWAENLPHESWSNDGTAFTTEEQPHDYCAD